MDKSVWEVSLCGFIQLALFNHKGDAEAFYDLMVCILVSDWRDRLRITEKTPPLA